MKMKYLILLLCASVFAITPTFAQKKADTGKKKTSNSETPLKEDAAPSEKKVVDFKLKPKIGEMKEIEFPAYSETTLKNGLKVIVIEDHKQPTISMRLQVRAGESFDGKKNGVSYLMANLLTKGTAKRSAEEIANQLDSVGANLSANAAGELVIVSVDGLKKYLPLLLGVFSDVVQNPTFPKEELDKLVPQVLASLKQEKSRPDALAAALSRMVVYGKDNPASQRKTEASVKSITIEDIRAFHKMFVRPNNVASIAVTGDISLNEIVPQLERAFSRWTPNTTLDVPTPPAAKSMPKGVYFIQRPGSVQTTVTAVALAPARNNEIYEKMQVASSLIGSGFAGRLFKTLRETYSFTYTPYAYMTQGKYYNRFIAGADVRNAVTDSAIMVLQRELEKVTADAAPDEELDLIKLNQVAEYAMSFERSDFVASILQNAHYLGLSNEFMKGYAKRINAITPFDVKQAAEKVIRKDKLYLVVVGAPDILPVLEKYGTVYSYNLDLEPLSGSNSMEKVSLSVNDVMKKAADAIGNTSSVQTLSRKISLTVEASGQKFNGTGWEKRKATNKQVFGIDLPVMKQQTWVNGKTAFLRQMNNAPEEMQGEDKTAAVDEASLFYYTKLPALGYTCEVVGKQGGQIVVSAKKGSKERQYYFDAKTFLLSRIDKPEDTPQGPLLITEKYENYTDVNGIKLPKVEKLESPMFTFTSENSWELNTPVDDKEFEAPKE